MAYRIAVQMSSRRIDVPHVAEAFAMRFNAAQIVGRHSLEAKHNEVLGVLHGTEIVPGRIIPNLGPRGPPQQFRVCAEVLTYSLWS